MTSALIKVSKAYWDSFYNGMMAVGLDPKNRPPFVAGNATENETMRCMRHAMEALRPYWGQPFDEVFPEKPMRRKAVMTANDVEIARRADKEFE